MTLAPLRPPTLEFEGIDEVVEALRRRGFRLSTARRVVLEALFAAEGPVSADFIAAGLGGSFTRSDLASVYRNLEWLEELGVVRHVHLGHGPGLYALAREGAREYLVCERCERVQSVDAARLDRPRAQIRKEFGFEARFSHFAIPGLCAECLDAVDESAAAGSGSTGGRSRRRDQAAPGASGETPHSHGHYVHSHPHEHGPGRTHGEAL